MSQYWCQQVPLDACMQAACASLVLFDDRREWEWQMVLVSLFHLHDVSQTGQVQNVPRKNKNVYHQAKQDFIPHDVTHSRPRNSFFWVVAKFCYQVRNLVAKLILW